MKDYITRAPRIIKETWVIGFIEKNNEKQADEAFVHFCSNLMQGKPINLACRITKIEKEIPLTVKCTTVKAGPKKTSSQEKPTFEVYVG